VSCLRGWKKKLARLARKVYRVLKIQGLGRIDVRLTPAGEIVTIEANPQSFPRARRRFRPIGRGSRLEYDALIQKILDCASI